MTLDRAATLRILLVDDHASFRETAHHVLQQEGCDVVGEVATGEAAIAAAVATRPDVVLLDVGLADVDGFTVAAALAVAVPATRVVLVSCRSVADLGPERIVASGAAGFVPKDTLSRAAIEDALARPAAA